MVIAMLFISYLTLENMVVISCDKRMTLTNMLDNLFETDMR